MKASFNDLDTIVLTSDDPEERLLLKGLLDKASKDVVAPAKPTLNITASTVIGGSVVSLVVGFLPPPAPLQSEPISASDVVVTNNFAGTSDVIKVSNRVAGDTIKVYASSGATAPIAIATVVDGRTDVTMIVDELGVAAGSIYVTVTSIDKTESTRTQVDYLAEA